MNNFREVSLTFYQRIWTKILQLLNNLSIVSIKHKGLCTKKAMLGFRSKLKHTFAAQHFFLLRFSLEISAWTHTYLLHYTQSKVRRRFRKILRPSQNIWTLHSHSTQAYSQKCFLQKHCRRCPNVQGPFCGKTWPPFCGKTWQPRLCVLYRAEHKTNINFGNLFGPKWRGEGGTVCWNGFYVDISSLH